MLVLSHPEVRNVPGLESPADFLGLEGLILGGHPDRHILQVDLPDLGRAFLKKEHRVRFLDRLQNLWHGFGFCSKSTREAWILKKLKLAGIGVPEILAFGEDGHRAFLLLKSVEGFRDLRQVLQEDDSRHEKIWMALALDLARLHRAGFCHGDLFAKHILVGPDDRFVYLDWQRGTWKSEHERQARDAQRPKGSKPGRIFGNTTDAGHPSLGARARTVIRRFLSPFDSRIADLAMLLASLPEKVLDGDLRECFLETYRRERELSKWDAKGFDRLQRSLAKRPRVREQRHLPLPAAQQHLIWLDGERYCATQSFREEFGDLPPGWLKMPLPARDARQSRDIPLSPNRNLILTWERSSNIGKWLRSKLRGRTPSAPAFLDAGAIFRLERHGVIVPRVLALGRQEIRPWSTISFLLTERLPEVVSLAEYLRAEPPGPARNEIVLQVEEVLGKIEKARHAWNRQFLDGLGIDATGRVVVTSVAGLERVSAKTRLRRGVEKLLGALFRPPLLQRWLAELTPAKGVLS